jgi:glutathione S-transferase
MADYTLYYWSVPFRGQFVRALLAYAGKTWDEVSDDEIGATMAGSVDAMPVPFMGPPVLIEERTGFAVSQMPAIIFYLGETLDLFPASAEERALTLKIVNDANDVIDELTLQGGRDMWDAKRFEESKARIGKWMRFWDVLGERHGLGGDSGYLLGGDRPGVADIVTATLWTTVADRFGKLEALLSENAPKTLALSRRIYELPALARLAADSRAEYGDDYAGGQIGKSMAKVLD